MTQEGNSKKTEKSISEADFSQMWIGMSHNQQRFAVAMLESSSKTEAALAIGIKPDTVYRWPHAIDTVIEYMREEARNSALSLLESSIVKAAAIKRAGLDSDDEKVRQDVASELLDRILGRAKQTTEISGRDGGPIETKTDVTSSELDRGIAEAMALLGKARERSAADDSATDNQ